MPAHWVVVPSSAVSQLKVTPEEELAPWVERIRRIARG